MSQFKTYNLGLTIKQPLPGATNYFQGMDIDTYTKISEHDHTGGGKGVQIGTSAIADGAISAAKLGLLSVDTGNLVDEAVSTVKLDDLAVTGAKIAAATIGESKLGFTVGAVVAAGASKAAATEISTSFTTVNSGSTGVKMSDSCVIGVPYYIQNRTAAGILWYTNPSASVSYYYYDQQVLSGNGIPIAPGEHLVAIRTSASGEWRVWAISGAPGAVNWAIAAGSSGAYTIFNSIGFQGLADGQTIQFLANHTNPITPAPTLKLGALPAYALWAKSGVALGGGAIRNGGIYRATYRAGVWFLNTDDEGLKTYSPSPSAAPGSWSPTVSKAFYRRRGGKVNVFVSATGTLSGTTNALSIPLPTSAGADATSKLVHALIYIPGASPGIGIVDASTNAVIVYRPDFSNFPAGSVGAVIDGDYFE